MDRHRAGVIAILITCACAMSAAQGKPSFAGTWIIQEPAKSAGQERIVKQDEKTLSMTGRGRTMTYDLSGVETKHVIPSRGGDVVMVDKAVWEGNTIVITTTTDYPNNIKTIGKETWSIDKQGHLVIDSTETSPTQPKEPPVIGKLVLARKS